MQIIKQRNGWEQTFYFQQPNGKPLDCSQFTIKFLVKKNKTDLDANAVLKAEWINPKSNILHCQFTAEETYIETGKYIGAIKLFRKNGMNEEIWVDEFIVEKGVINE